MEKRTSWDFSEYTHRVEVFKSEEGNEIRVDHLQNGDSSVGYVKFVNDSRGLSVFGDFGNWIFCRPFHPSPDGFVSFGYWNEKLKTYSCQDHAKYDSDRTLEEIKDLINGGLEEIGLTGDELEKGVESLKCLSEYVDDEIEYLYHAYRGFPNNLDYEYIPYVKTASYRLLVVFDAFDEICKRLK